jgi:crossover junction endodeoxyribonuclease RusA
VIVLPWPPASLSGHAGGGWRKKAAETKRHREWAFLAAFSWKQANLEEYCDVVAWPGDIRVHVRFVPPDRRSDRTNFANRCKPYFDGLADALGVNDRRFVPVYTYDEPSKPGSVTITLEAA